MTILNLIAAAIVLLRGLHAANHMCPRTSMQIRITWVLLTVGAAAVLLSAATPTWPDVVLHWGVAALVLFDRRNPLLKGTSCN